MDEVARNVSDEKVVLFQRKQHAVKKWIEKILKIELSSGTIHNARYMKLIY